MADPQFFDRANPVTLSELCALTGADLPDTADQDLTIDGAAPLEMAEPSFVSYLDHPRHEEALKASPARVAFVPLGVELDGAGTVLVPAENPKLAYARALDRLYTTRHWQAADGDDAPQQIQPGAHVHETAELGPGTVVHPGAVIEADVTIGRRCVIGPGAVIAQGVRIGDDCRFDARVVVQCALIGNRVRLLPGVAIGQDGFGYVFQGGAHHWVPQIGRVIIEDDVDIGAGTTIDRGASGDTVIGSGSKIDNLVQIGHNCRLGRGVIVVSQVGISGSTTVEDYAVLGGQVGIADHVTIGAGAQLAARSGVISDIPAGTVYAGYPARPIQLWRREQATLARITRERRPNAAKKGEAPGS